MGYYVSMEIDNVRILKSKVKACLKAINDLHHPDVMKTRAGGGSSNGDFWYSWVHNPPGEGFRTLPEAFNAWRYSVSTNKDGSINLECFNGEKWGDDEVLFQTIAPFVKDDDGSIEIRGEGNDMWRYLFKKGKVISQTPTITWEDDC